MGCGTTKNALQAINAEVQPIPTTTQTTHSTLPPEVLAGFGNILKSSITPQAPITSQRPKTFVETKGNLLVSPGEQAKTGHFITPSDGETRGANKSDDVTPAPPQRNPTLPDTVVESAPQSAAVDPVMRYPTLPSQPAAVPMRAPTMPSQPETAPMRAPTLSSATAPVRAPTIPTQSLDEAIPEQAKARMDEESHGESERRDERVPTLPQQDDIPVIEDKLTLTASQSVRDKLEVKPELEQQAMLNAYYETPVTNPYLELMKTQEQGRVPLDEPVQGETDMPPGNPREAFVAASPEVVS